MTQFFMEIIVGMLLVTGAAGITLVPVWLAARLAR